MRESHMISSTRNMANATANKMLLWRLGKVLTLRILVWFLRTRVGSCVW